MYALFLVWKTGPVGTKKTSEKPGKRGEWILRDSGTSLLIFLALLTTTCREGFASGSLKIRFPRLLGFSEPFSLGPNGRTRTGGNARSRDEGLRRKFPKGKAFGGGAFRPFPDALGAPRRILGGGKRQLGGRRFESRLRPLPGGARPVHLPAMPPPSLLRLLLPRARPLRPGLPKPGAATPSPGAAGGRGFPSPAGRGPPAAARTTRARG